MPRVDSWSKMLMGRPHVRETDHVPLRHLAFGIGCLNAFGDLLRRFAFHPKFAAQIVIRYYGSRCRWVETNMRVDLWVIDEITKLCRGIRLGAPPIHHHANKTVVTFLLPLCAQRPSHFDSTSL